MNNRYRLGSTVISLEDNGAVQVDEAKDVPLKVFIAGPIKYWWGTQPDGTRNWDLPLREKYMMWRDAVRLAVVGTGFCVTYCPHRAIQGAWHPDLQLVNNVAIKTSDVMINLTPPGIPAEGTAGEIWLAVAYGVKILHVPPGSDEDLSRLIDELRALREEHLKAKREEQW